ncbi:DNA polymerase III subunit gamma/tau [Mediterraneibacter glycyrrhizinilyticus]|uniref:DNA polymerase III subunit gamma/tau n=1 Tax=Mediterraneibacter glycyrrhizinilyticus TaxID=342942 RepID=UPI0025A36606|nr:DNA polymerase III subunit gamma/tau [Mediterraneibacter glycyrrhizinilyticus]MDM8126326.1 DNA polymerase III subunit gamma/tau [Mediterraneibacter glycyrrhizinilyticus]
MSYTALYRKFRPSEFADVKGQDHIITTLQNQIRANRIGHAYLFCGTRGTGKTTVAKIFAKAVNCEHPVDGSPCGECETCRSIAAGTSMNVIEIDAASNNGVDNIREIREEVAYRPTEGRYKVYIIDEVHMLSIGAFNALLKTLEEPPEYVIFILATTEVHKIPITILSRCQHYDFKRISIETITDRMKELMDTEHVEVEDKALRYIAKAADGSMRDALSLLDQCIAFYMGQKLTYDNVLEVLGAVDTDVFSRLLRKVIDRDVAGVLDVVDDLVMQGRELTQLAADFTWYLRNLLLVKTSDNIEDVLDVSTENMAQLKEEAQMIEPDMLFRYIRIFSELSNQLKYATQKRVMLEVALIKLCTPAMENTQDSLLDRIRAVEEKVEKGIDAAAVFQAQGGYGQDSAYGGAGGNGAGMPGGGSGAAGSAGVRKELPNAIPEDVQEVVKNFRSIAGEASGILRGYLKKARLSLGGDNRLMIVLPDPLSESVVGREDHVQELENLIEQRIGKKVEVEVRHVEEGRHFEDTFVDIEQKINMEITVED